RRGRRDPFQTDGAGDRRRDGAAHARIGHLLHEHDQWEDERDAGKRIGTQAADEMRIDGRRHGNTTLTTTLGAARRSSVETIGPSRKTRRVPAAAGRGTVVAAMAWASEPLPLGMGSSSLDRGAGAALGRSVFLKPGGCR